MIDYQGILNTITSACSLSKDRGKIATYIPELAKLEKLTTATAQSIF